MKVIECPKCQGRISVDSEEIDERIYVCEHCGTRFRRKLSKSAMGAKVRVRELEHEETMADKDHQHELDLMDKEVEIEEKKGASDIKLIFGVLAFFVGMIAVCGILLHFTENPGFVFGSDQVKVSKSAGDMRGSDHVVIEDELVALGFTNVDSRAMGDMGILEDINPLITDGAIDYISIDGDSDFKQNTWFAKDAKVIIKYHSHPD